MRAPSLLTAAHQAALALFLSLAACGASDASTAPAARPEPAIATVHRGRCGACHVRVDPGARTRDALTVALLRHRTRMHLSEAQWTALVDYLAVDTR